MWHATILMTRGRAVYPPRRVGRCGGVWILLTIGALRLVAPRTPFLKPGPGRAGPVQHALHAVAFTSEPRRLLLGAVPPRDVSRRAGQDPQGEHTGVPSLAA